MAQTVIVRPKRGFYRAMTDDELWQHLQDLWTSWRFSETDDAVLERHWALVWVELRHRGLLTEADDVRAWLEHE